MFAKPQSTNPLRYLGESVISVQSEGVLSIGSDFGRVVGRNRHAQKPDLTQPVVTRKRDPFWPETIEVGTQIRCKHCDKIYQRTLFKIWNFKGHMKTNHPQVYAKLCPPQRVVFTNDSELNQHLLGWLVKTCRPFSLVEDEEFRGLVYELNPKLEPLGRTQLVDRFLCTDSARGRKCQGRN